MSGYGFSTGTGGYDTENRLIAWNRSDTTLDQSWNLTPAGDWNVFTENSVPESRVHGPAHELATVDLAALLYDPKGNLTEDDEGIGYAWDFDNLLSASTVPQGASRGIEGTHTYTYDALGRRVSKTVNGITTVFISMLHRLRPVGTPSGQVLAEYENGTLAREFVYGEYVDEPLILVDRTALGSLGAAIDELLYYHRTQIYNVSGLTNAAGTPVELYAYEPYGMRIFLTHQP